VDGSAAGQTAISGLYMYFQPFFDDPTVITAAGWDQFVDAA
jgi:hypothetical protein